MTNEEIENYLEEKNYNIDLSDYSKIVSTSPQINNIMYEKPFFKIFTSDNKEFKVKVKTLFTNNK